MDSLVIDIGGTYIKYGTMDQEGNLTEKEKIPTPQNNLDQLLSVICKICMDIKEIDGIGLSIPAVVNSDQGIICSGGNLAYLKDVNIVRELEQRLAISVAVENDANCAALAELWKGSLADIGDGIVIVCGTGIGGTIIHERKIIKGSHYFAGEFCFMLTDYELSSGNLLNRIVSSKCSVPALIHDAAESMKISVDQLSGELIFDEAENGNESVMAAIKRYTSRLAILLLNMQVFIDPQRVAVGGGISARPLFIEMIKESLKELAERHPSNIPIPEIVPCHFYNSSNLIGAGYNLRLKMHKDSK